MKWSYECNKFMRDGLTDVNNEESVRNRVNEIEESRRS
jgi:hypothetical protein